MNKRNYDLLLTIVKTIANFTLDGEDLDGKPFEMQINQAYEDLKVSVERCRIVLGLLDEEE